VPSRSACAHFVDFWHGCRRSGRAPLLTARVVVGRDSFGRRDRPLAGLGSQTKQRVFLPNQRATCGAFASNRADVSCDR
jgi:hypothetical protein